MVTRDLTCDETMPPLDDGDNINLIEMRKMRSMTSAAAFTHYQQQPVIVQNLVDIGSVAEDGSELNHTTTVRDVVTRQIRNSKLKNEARQLGFAKLGLLETNTGTILQSSTAPTQMEHQIMLNNTSLNNNHRHPAPMPTSNGRTFNHRKNSAFHNNNDEHLHQHSSIIVKTTGVACFGPNNNNQTAPLDPSQFQQAMINSSFPETHIVRIMDRNSDSNQHHIDQPQQQINHWIQQQTTAAVADNSTLHYQQSMPKKLVNILVAESHQPTLHAFNNMADSSSLSYAVVLPPNEETNSSTGTENPGQQGPSTSIQAAHSSPRPSILRGNTSLRRLAERGDRPASASELCDAYGNGPTRLQNCSSHGGDESNGGDETPRKRARKQYFGDSAQPDKLLMEVCAASAASAVNVPILNTTTIRDRQQQQPTTIPASISPAFSLGKEPKKRGRRPKMKNSNPTQSMRTVTEELTNSTSTTGSEGSHFAPRLMVEVDSRILHANNFVKKRAYKKKTPEVDPETGEVMKKQRKKGSGRKSKHEMEKVAKQERESLILAGVGIEFTHNHQQQPNNQGNDNIIGANAAQKIAAEEHNVIHTLCRFRRDSERREAERTTTAQNDYQPSTSTADNKVLPQILRKSKLSKKSVKQILVSNFTKHSAATSQPRASLPLLAGLSEIDEILPLLKRCDNKVLTASDTANLTETYEELRALLKQADDQEEEDPTKPTTSSSFDSRRANRKARIQNHEDQSNYPIDDILCPVIESSEKFNSAMNALRLFPHACAYFDASQRLLHSLRTNLLGQSLYKQLSTRLKLGTKVDSKLDEKQAERLVPLSTLKLKRPKEEEEKLLSQLFSRALEEFVAKRGNDNVHDGQPNDDNNDSLDDQFLAQLDVAQSMDSLLDLVTNRGMDRNRPLLGPTMTIRQPNMDELPNNSKQSTEPQFEGITTSAFHLDVRQRVPKDILQKTIGERVQKRKLRRRKKWRESEGDDSELGPQGESSSSEDQMDCDENAEDRLCKSVFVRIGSICRNTHRHLFQIEQLKTALHPLIEKAKAHGRGRHPPEFSIISLLTKQDGQRSRNPHKPNSPFLLRPPTEQLKQLLGILDDGKTVQQLQTKNAAGCRVESSSSAEDCGDGKKGKTRNPSSKQSGGHEDCAESSVNNNNNNGVPEEKLHLEDLEEMLDHAEHISNSSLAQLRLKYAGRFGNMRTCHGSNIGISRNFPGLFDTEDDDCDNELFTPSLLHVMPPDSESEQQQEFLQARIHELQEICITTLGLVQSRATLVKEFEDCVQEFMDGRCERGGHQDENGQRRVAAHKSAGSNNNSKSNNNHPALMAEEETRESSVPRKRAAHRRAMNNIRTGSCSRTGSIEMMDTG